MGLLVNPKRTVHAIVSFTSSTKSLLIFVKTVSLASPHLGGLFNFFNIHFFLLASFILFQELLR